MNNSIVKNMAWRFAETMGAQIVSFIVSVFLARLLAPNDYGVIAIIIIFINIANVFAESGLGTSLIQKKGIDNKDFSTIFYFNIFFSILIYFILYFSAPLIASFYDNELITALIRVLGVRIIVSSVNSVQKAYVSKTMQFKCFFFSTISGTVFSAILGIALAYCGAGAWALVFQYLSNVIIDTIVLWFTVKWRPNLYFSFKRLKVLFSFGFKILVTSLVNEIFIQSKSLIIGKVYTASDLAYFNKGQQIPAVLTSGIGTTINSVMFPVMATNQDSIIKVKDMLRKTTAYLSFYLITSLIFLAVISPTLIPFLLTNKWQSSIIYLQIAAINNIFVLLQSVYTDAFKAIGSVNLFMKISILQKILNMILILLFMFSGPVYIVLGEAIVSTLMFMLTSYFASKRLQYQISEQIKDIIKIFLINVMAAMVILMVNYTIDSYMYKLLVDSIIYMGAVLALSYIFKYDLVINIINSIIRKLKCFFYKF